jgi:hypothetical protein
MNFGFPDRTYCPFARFEEEHDVDLRFPPTFFGYVHPDGTTMMEVLETTYCKMDRVVDVNAPTWPAACRLILLDTLARWVEYCLENIDTFKEQKCAIS